MSTPEPDAIEAARQRGAEDARAAVARHAPDDPLLRVAWAMGFGQIDHVRAAVAVARDAGCTWAQIASITGEKDRRTAEMKYGAGYERMRRYRERKKAD